MGLASKNESIALITKPLLPPLQRNINRANFEMWSLINNAKLKMQPPGRDSVHEGSQKIKNKLSILCIN